MANRAGSEFEFRLHTGLHAGAHVVLTGSTYVLGSAPDCDFVLADDGVRAQHALLKKSEVDGSVWTVQYWDETDGEPGQAQALERGLLMSSGPLVFSLNDPLDEWPDDEQIRLARKSPQNASPQGASEAADLAQASELAEQANALPVVIDEPVIALVQDDVRSRGATRPRSLWRMPVLLSCLVVVAMLALGWLLWPILSTSEAEPRAAVNIAAPAPIDLNAIKQIIASQAMTGLVGVEIGPDGLPVVKAVYLEDSEYEKLALALSRLTPRPGLQVGTEQDLMEAVKEAVAARAAESGVKLQVISLGQGRYRIEGRLGDRKQGDAMMGELRAALPRPVELESAFALIEDDALKMVSALQSAQLGDISGQWADGKLHLIVKLLKAELPSWEQLIDRASQRFNVPFVAALEFVQVHRDKQADLPFRLQSIVSGDTPYVTLVGGTRLFIDGSTQGWRLASIDDRSVVFDSKSLGRVVVLR